MTVSPVAPSGGFEGVPTCPTVSVASASGAQIDVSNISPEVGAGATVSVVIPNYNHARFLERRIRSVLEQTYRPVEVIILDDHSTDDSWNVIQRFKEIPGLHLVRNPTNSGSPFTQWNRGVQLTRGEFVWIAESDDDADPTFLATLIERLNANPNAVLAYCQSRTIDERGESSGLVDRVFEHLQPGRWKSDFQSPGIDELNRSLLLFNTLPNASAVVFRRSTFLAAGGADESMRYCGDWMTWARLCLCGDLLYVSVPLNDFRLYHGSASTQRNSRRMSVEANRVRSFIRSQFSGRISQESVRANPIEFWDRSGMAAPDLDALRQLGPWIAHALPAKLDVTKSLHTSFQEPLGGAKYQSKNVPESIPQDRFDCAILILTFNNAQTLGSVIAALRTQTVRPVRILCVDSGSCDETEVIAKTHQVDLVSCGTNPSGKPAVALNIGISSLDHEWIFCISPDIQLNDPNILLQLLLQARSDPNVIAAYAQTHACGQPPHELLRCVRVVDSGNLTGFNGFCDHCGLIRRSAWEQQQFPEELPCCHDEAWAARSLSTTVNSRVLRIEGLDVRELDGMRSRWRHVTEFITIANHVSPAHGSWSSIFADLREGIRAVRHSRRIRGHWKLQRAVCLALYRLGILKISSSRRDESKPPRWIRFIF